MLEQFCLTHVLYCTSNLKLARLLFVLISIHYHSAPQYKIRSIPGILRAKYRVLAVVVFNAEVFSSSLWNCEALMEVKKATQCTSADSSVNEI